MYFTGGFVLNHKNISFYLLSCAAIVLFAALSCFVGGVIQLAAGILVAVLIGLQTRKYHYGYVASSALLLFATPLVLCALPADSDFGSAVVYAALLTVPLILMGLTLGFSANMKLSFYRTAVILTGIYLAGLLTDMKLLSDASVALSPENIVADSIGQFQTALETVYGNNPEALDLMGRLLGEIAKMMLTLTPAIFILLSLGTAFISLMIFKALCGKQQLDVSFWPSFCGIRGDKTISVLFLLVFVLNVCAPEGLFSDLTLNVVVVLSIVFLLFGFSFLDWKLRSRGWKRLPRRLLIIACIPFCTSFFMLPFLILVILGLTDGLFDFRARKTPKKL